MNVKAPELRTVSGGRRRRQRRKTAYRTRRKSFQQSSFAVCGLWAPTKWESGSTSTWLSDLDGGDGDGGHTVFFFFFFLLLTCVAARSIHVTCCIGCRVAVRDPSESSIASRTVCTRVETTPSGNQKKARARTCPYPWY